MLRLSFAAQCDRSSRASKFAIHYEIVTLVADLESHDTSLVIRLERGLRWSQDFDNSATTTVLGRCTPQRFLYMEMQDLLLGCVLCYNVKWFSIIASR